MIRIDSLKMKITREAIGDDEGLLRFGYKRTLEVDDVVVDDVVYINDVGKGIKYIGYDLEKREVILEISAKINDDYKLITKENIYDVFEKINSVGLITFDVEKAVENSEVLKTDFCVNLMVGSVDEYLFDLSVLSLPSKIERSTHKGSVIFREKKKTTPLRMIFYDKHNELLKDKEMRHLANQFKGILRYEINFKYQRLLKKYFGTTNLLKILKSRRNIYKEVFERLTGINQQRLPLELIYSLSELNKRDIMKFFKARGLLTTFEGVSEAKTFLVGKGFTPSYVYRMIREAREFEMRFKPKESERIRRLLELIS